MTDSKQIMTESNSDPIRKNVLQSLEVIYKITKATSFSIDFKDNYIHKSKIKIIKDKEDFKFSLELPTKPGKQLNDELESLGDGCIKLKNRSRNIYVEPKNLFTNNIAYTTLKTKILTGKVNGFSSVPDYNKRKDSFIRLMIPSKKSILIIY